MSLQQTLICPHCMSQVPRGAHVCRGCQAEVHYGAPRWVSILCAILSVIGGWWVVKAIHMLGLTHSATLWILFAVFALALKIWSGRLCKRFYADRTVFRRLYRS